MLDKIDSDFAQVLDHLDTGVALYGIDGRLIDCNHGYLGIFCSVDKTQVVGETFMEIRRLLLGNGEFAGAAPVETPDTWLEAQQNAFRQCLGEGCGFQLSDGRWFEVRYKKIEDGRTLVEYHETTESRLWHNRLIDAIESIPDAFALWDAHDCLVLCNEKFREYYAPVRDHIVPGVAFNDLLRTMVDRGMMVTGEAGNPHISDMVARRHRLPDVFDEVLIDGSWRKVVERRGRDGGLVGVETDVTVVKELERAFRENQETLNKYSNQLVFTLDDAERKGEKLTRLAEDLCAARSEAEIANVAKSELLGRLSHQLLSPLNSIIEFAELTHMTLPKTKELARFREYANDIHQNGQQLVELINDLLDISEIQSGQRQFKKEEIDLGEVLDECLDHIHKLGKDSGVTLCRELPPCTERLMADRVAVKQVLLNLLSNAIQYSPTGGTVNTAIEYDGGWAFVTVKDNGVGISPQQLEQIATPFAQFKASLLTQKSKGLGLTLSKYLLEMHGGRLEIDSVFGTGTTVKAVLPTG